MTGGGVVFGPPVSPARAHSTASSVGSCSSTQQQRGRERQSGTSGGSARSALGQHTLPMEAELERDWAYLCQTFTEKGEEKQYTELSAPPLLPLISPVEDEGDVEHVLEGGEDFAAIDFVRTGVAVEEVSPPTVVGDVAEAEERVREALGMPSMAPAIPLESLIHPVLSPPPHHPHHQQHHQQHQQHSSHFESVERLLCNGELPPGSSPSQSTLAESILDTASLLPIPDSDMSWEPTPSSQSFYPGADQENWASYQTQPTVPRIVTKLMPYRLRKVDPGLREDEERPVPHKLTRDERAALNLRLPFPVSNIISSSMEEFGEMLNTWPLTEQQINLCRDIRRRGKNKIAAQNCRRRKMEQITELEEEVAAVKNRRERLIKERIGLEESKRVAQERLDRLESFICANLGGQGWKIKVTADEKVQVVSLEGEEVDLNDLLSAA